MKIRMAAAVSILGIVLWPMISDAKPKKTTGQCDLDYIDCGVACDKKQGKKVQKTCNDSCYKTWTACTNDAAEPELESDGNIDPKRRTPGKLPNVDIQPQ